MSDLPPIGSQESEKLDFKAQGYGNSEKDHIEAARDVAQFANHLGGTIILGAQEENSILKEYVGLPEIAVHGTRIRDICTERVEPSISIDRVEIDCDGKKVLAINVYPCFSAVGVRVNRNRYEFPIRRNDKKDFLTLQEVAMMGTSERRGLLLLGSIPQGSCAKLRIDAEDLDKLPPRGWRLEETGPGYARLKVLDISVYLPLAFIEAVWPSDSYGEYTVTVRARFHITENGKKVEISRARTW